MITILQGVGFGSTIIDATFSIYGMVVMAWSIYYLFHSIAPGRLPWTSCGELLYNW